MTTEGLQKAKETMVKILKEADREALKVVAMPICGDYYAVGAWFNMPEEDDIAPQSYFKEEFTDYGRTGLPRVNGFWSTKQATGHFSAACVLLKGDEVLLGDWCPVVPREIEETLHDPDNRGTEIAIYSPEQPDNPLPSAGAIVVERGFPDDQIYKKKTIKNPIMTDDCLVVDVDRWEISMNLQTRDEEGEIDRVASASIKIPPEIKENALEESLTNAMESPNPNRSTLRSHVARLKVQEKEAIERFREGLKPLTVSDKNSPRYKRAALLKEQHKQYGLATASAVAQKLRQQDDLGNEARKQERQNLQAQFEEVQKVTQKRKSIIQKLRESTPERSAKAAQIVETTRNMRQKIGTTQASLTQTQDDLEKAKNAYVEFKNRQKQKEQKPEQPKTSPNLWKRFFGRGGK